MRIVCYNCSKQASYTQKVNGLCITDSTLCFEAVNMKIIGITGAIGCGKTTVANVIRDLGFEVFDADVGVKAIYENPAFLMQLKGVFPRVFRKDGTVDKPLLRKIVFCNQAELLKLENIIEPFLSEMFLNKVNSVAGRQGWLFIDAALLIEKGWNQRCDKVIGVDADLETQKRRVMARDNISEEEFFNIYNLQMNNAKKCELVDVVVNTQCDLSELKQRVKKVLKDLEVL